MLLLAACNTQPRNTRRLSIFNREDNGAYAYAQWLRELGYTVVVINGTPGRDEFKIPPNASAVIMLDAFDNTVEEEAAVFGKFVSDGGTMIYNADAGTRFIELALSSASVSRVSTEYEELMVVDPLPSGVGEDVFLPCEANGYITPAESATQSAARVRAESEGGPAILSFNRNAGRVHMSTASCIFYNESLEDNVAALLARDLLRDLPAGSVIAFDEYHLNPRYEPPSPRQAPGPVSRDFSVGLLMPQLFNTPWGIALVLGFLLGFGYLLLNGRRFGRPVPLLRDIKPRAGAEYVHAMAGLYRRAGTQDVAVDHLKQRLKRGLGARLGVEPDLDNEEFVRALQRAGAVVDANALRALLFDLSNQRDEKPDLVSLAQRTYTLLDQSR